MSTFPTHAVAPDTTARADAASAQSAADNAQAELDAFQDQLVVATIAVGNSATDDATLTLQLRRVDNSTAIASARQVVIYGTATQYDHYASLVATLTFITATTGSIIASGAGWALVQTDATGAFACTAHNTANGTVYCSVDVPSSGVSDVTKGVFSVISNSDAGVWS